MRPRGGLCWLLVLVPALAGQPAGSQAPPPWSYYPLGIGDAWEYDEQWRETTLRVENVGEIVIAGRAYVVQTRTRFDSLGNAIQAFPRSSLRYDSASTFVMWASFTVPGQEFEWGFMPCPLNAQPPSAGCGTGGGTVWAVETYIADLIIGDTTVVAIRHKWFGVSGHYFVLAEGVGEVLRQPKFDPPGYADVRTD